MQLFDNITPELHEWILQQKMFFVGTAPLTGTGHVNLSPKGNNCLRILDDSTVCYMDMSGSGNETSAHIDENGRITIMLCAFEGSPRILRLYGTGEVVLKGSDKYEKLLETEFGGEMLPGTRQIIMNHVTRVQTSCGYAVPFMDYKEDRETLQKFFKVKEKQDGAMQDYWRKKNMASIDGLQTTLAQKLG